MLIEKVGDIFTTEEAVIAQGVNVEGLMGSGIARIIADRYPNVESEYVKACAEGSLQPGGVQVVEAPDGKLIANAASQVLPGRNADYVLLVLSIKATFDWCEKNDVSGFAVPRIGAGIGGLEWSIVLQLLYSLAALYPDVTLEVWSLPDAA